MSYYHGHRRRLRQRFRMCGESSFQDYELLEILLFRSIPRQDTKPLAKMLLKRFGSFSEVLAAPPHLLREIRGVGENVVDDLKLLHATALRFARRQIRDKEFLASFQAVLEYCYALMAFSEKEEFRVLFLDKRNALIADERQQCGTIDHTSVYPREIIKRALELSATALVLVHNHPSGDPTPSASDVQMTRQLVQIAQSLGIEIHDHIIIGREGHVSMKGLKLI